jgi:hypothetical protein
MCELCGKVMGRKWCKKEHMLTVHGVVPKNGTVFECDRCEKKFLDANR